MGGYQGDYRYAAPGSGLEATWSFEGLTDGATYTIYGSWKSNGNRSRKAPFDLTDDAGSLGTFTVDEYLSPNDLYADGTWWEALATVTVRGDTLVVRSSAAPDGYVVADGMRLVETAPEDGGAMDDGDMGYADSGWSYGSEVGGYQDDYRYSAAGGVRHGRVDLRRTGAGRLLRGAGELEGALQPGHRRAV